MGDILALLIVGLLVWAALSKRSGRRYAGYYLEPMGSHATDPFEEQSNHDTNHDISNLITTGAGDE